MAIQMTRAQYEAKYGKSPISQPVQSAPKQQTGIGQKVLNAGTAVSNFFGGKGVADTFGSEIAKIGKTPQEKASISQSQPTLGQTAGSALQLGANFLPGAGSGAGLLAKVGAGVGTGLAFDVGSKLQNKQTPTPGIGTAVGLATPLAGAVLRPASKIVGRLLKGLGSGLSGVSTDTIEKIVNNPRAAQLATDKLAKTGNAKVLEENAKTILGGVSKIRQEARKAFGEGLDSLAETDIKPDVFRAQTQSFLDKYGAQLTPKGRQLTNVEFSDPKNLSKAKELIDKLHNAKLDGKSIRKLADDIENSAYKIATGDERLSFNAFVKDLSQTVKGAVKSSTDKLGQMDKQFSSDMQLAEAAEKIFGRVNFKNLSEVVRASQKLETLFSQKGLAPEVVDQFLTRIGIDPSDFKTGEAVRQISNKTSGANTKGLSVGEVVQQATSAVVTPQTVRNVATKLGIAEQTLLPELKKLSPAVRSVILNFLVQNNQ